MTQEQIIEGNKLIAEFMGNEKVNRNTSDDVYLHYYKYHYSWDWLMSSWLKILKWGVDEHGVQWTQELTQDGVFISANRNTKCKFSVFAFRGAIEIKDVWYLVVEFIKWYNSKTQQL